MKVSSNVLTVLGPRQLIALRLIREGIGVGDGLKKLPAFGARRLGAALWVKTHHQITFSPKNLLNTNSRAVS